MQIRTFIALTLSEDVKSFLGSVVSDFSGLDVRASWTKPGNFHLTLKFLGDVEESFISSITAKLEDVSMSLPHDFKFTSISAFPNLSKPRVFWYGFLDKVSVNLHQQVENICAELGFERDKKPFRSHLTLGRIKRGIPNVVSLLDKYANEKIKGRFESLSLFKSDLTPSGPHYTQLWEKR